MAARKRVPRGRKARPKARPSKAKAAGGQIDRLTATVHNLRIRLVEEARRRKLDQRLLAEAKQKAENTKKWIRRLEEQVFLKKLAARE